MNECALSLKQQYQKIILDQYKDAVFISLAELATLHKLHNPDTYTFVKETIEHALDLEQKEPCVAYVLGAGIATADSFCCNGIRYGIDGSYISLPQLPSHVWVPF